MSEKEDVESGRAGVQSVEFAMEILRLLADSSEALSLSSLAKKSGMAPSRVHKYLFSLLKVGLVQQTARGQYDVGSMALELGFAALGRLEVTAVAQDYMDALRDKLRLDCCLAIWADGGPVIVRRSQSSEPISLFIQLGQRLPIRASANGLVFAAFLDDSRVNDVVEVELRKDATDGDELRRAKTSLESALQEVRNNGMSIVSETMLTGVNAISCPVFDYRKKMVAALTIFGLAHRLPATSTSEPAKALREISCELSRHLGLRGGDR